jgi:hypothetical protein
MIDTKEKGSGYDENCSHHFRLFTREFGLWHNYKRTTFSTLEYTNFFSINKKKVFPWKIKDRDTDQMNGIEFIWWQAFQFPADPSKVYLFGKKSQDLAYLYFVDLASAYDFEKQAP